MLEHISKSDTELGYNISCEELAAVLIRKYGQPCDDYVLCNSLRNLESTFGRLTLCKKMRVLDLGCGALGTMEGDANPGLWEPWLCRAIHELGGTAVGIDIGYRHRLDEFDFRQRDLLRGDALSDLPDRSFDAINCTYLFSSPHLVFRLINFNESLQVSLRDRLERETHRLLKPDGKVIEFDRDIKGY